MDNVLWLARIFGPFFFIMGLWMILRSDDVMKLWKSVKSTPAVLYLGGVLNLLIGLTMLSTYSGWSFGVPLLLTLLGYIIFFRGVVVLFAPEKILELSERLMPMQKKLAYIPLVIGAIITLYAFF